MRHHTAILLQLAGFSQFLRSEIVSCSKKLVERELIKRHGRELALRQLVKSSRQTRKIVNSIRTDRVDNSGESMPEPQLAKHLIPTYKLIYKTGFAVAAGRGYQITDTMTFFCPLEAVADALGKHRTTITRQLKVFKELNLINYRPLKASVLIGKRKRTRTVGCIFAIHRTPTGSLPKLTRHDMTCERDLAADIERGRTIFATQQSLNYQQLDPLAKTLYWALNIIDLKPPVGFSDCCTRHDLPALADDRSLLEPLAGVLVRELNDPTSRKFYVLLLKRLAYLAERNQNYLYSVLLALERTLADTREAFARTPAALFVSRLKAAPFWDLVWRTPTHL